MRIWQILLMGAILGGVIPSVFAQETYVAEGEAFFLSYPSEWRVVNENGQQVVFSAPVEGELIEVTFQLLQNATSAEALVYSLIDSEAEIYDTLHFDVQGKRAFAIGLAAGALDENIVAMEAGLGQVMVASLTGRSTQVEALGAQVVSVLASFRFSDEALNYVRPDNSIGFRYPADWLVEENADYTLLILPNGVSLGVSALPTTDENAVLMQAERVRAEALTSEAIDLAADEEIQSFEFNNLPAARVDLKQGDFLLIYMVFTLDETTLLNLTILGEPELAESALEQALNLAETVYQPVLKEETRLESALDLNKTYTSQNGDIQFDYPLGWVVLQEAEQIVLASSQEVLDSGSLDELPAGEAVILIFPSLRLLPEAVQANLGEDPVPLEVIAALSTDVVSPQREKQDIGGRSGAISISEDADFQFFDVAVLMPNGDIVSLLGTVRHGGLVTYQQTFLAIAESLTPQ